MPVTKLAKPKEEKETPPTPAQEQALGNIRQLAGFLTRSQTEELVAELMIGLIGMTPHDPELEAMLTDGGGEYLLAKEG